MVQAYKPKLYLERKKANLLEDNRGKNLQFENNFLEYIITNLFLLLSFLVKK